MSKRENFTAGRVAAFKCEHGKTQSIFWDGKAPGLGLRVTPAGVKSYIFETRLDGKTLRVTIGDERTWTISKAQEEATRLKTMTDQGDDPRQVKAEKQAAAEAKREDARHAEAPALEAWKIYVATRQAKWSVSHRAYHETVSKAGGEPRTRGRRSGESDTTQPGPLLPLLSLPLGQITADAVRQWLKDEAATRPTFARLAFSLLRAFLNWCADRPEYRAYVHVDACASRLTRDELPKKAAKDDCLQREQLPLWFEHVRKLRNPVHSAYLQALLLTGARREELAPLKWDDVDFQWKSLTIKDKVEGSRTIPLTPFVASLLAALPRRNEWVFSSPAAASGRLMEPRTGHNKALPPLACLRCPCTACAVPSAPRLNGSKCLPVSWRKSWGTNRARPPRSITVAVRSTCCACGTSKSKHGFLNKQGLNFRQNKPVCGLSPEKLNDKPLCNV